MTEQNSLVDQSQDSKKTIERSSRYPSIDLKTAIEYIDALKTAMGIGPYNRLSVAQGIGYRAITGTSGSRVAALVYYGLLTKTGDTYSLSALSSRILYVTSSEDKELAIQEAVKSPALFKSLITRYEGNALPTLLKNILIREYHILEQAADDVVRIFTKSLEYSGLLKNGVIFSKVTVPMSDEFLSNKNHEVTNEDDFSGNPLNYSKNKNNDLPVAGYPVILPSGITITFPNEMSYRVLLGEFAKPIKDIEIIANSKEIKKSNDEGVPERS